MTPSEHLASLALSLGLPAAVGEDDVVEWEDELILERAWYGVLVRAVVEGEAVHLRLGCPLLDCDLERLDAVEDVPEPLLGLYADLDDELEDEDDPTLWLVVEATVDLAAGAAGLHRVRDAAEALIADLAVVGTVRITDACEIDPSIAAALEMLQGLKARRPLDALDSTLELADRSRNVGDFVTAAKLDLAAADVAYELGRSTLCWGLTEPAWLVLGAPEADAALASAYAKALAARGDLSGGLEVLERTERLAPDRPGSRLARGNRAVLLLSAGRFPDAIPLLESVVADPDTDEDHRTDFAEQLAEARRSIGVPEGAGAPLTMDVLNSADWQLNDLAARVQELRMASLEEDLGEIESAGALLRARWDLLGPGQRARLLIVEAAVALARGDRDEAGRRLRMAARTGEEAGDALVTGWAASAEAAFRPETAAPATSGDPRERLMYHFNRGYWALRDMRSVGDIEDGLRSALEAVKVVDEARHRFTSLADRKTWAHLGARAYEVGLAVATVLGRSSVVVELLERLRAQGLPVPPDLAPLGPALLLPVGPLSENGEQAPAVGAVLRDLLVGAPAVATVSGGEDGTVRLAEVVATVAGPGAWWWACHTFGRRVYWAVRSPDGTVAVGAKTEDRVAVDLDRIGSRFTTPRTPAAKADHPMVGDRAGTRDGLLAELAEAVLPPVLADAARAAAAAGRPLRLVWAPPPALGGVPVGLLPVGGGFRLLHGAVVTLAPPTSLVAEAVGRPPRSGPRRERIVVGSGIAHAGALLGALDAPAAPEATPAEVRRRWADGEDGLCLYYGHVDPGRPGQPLTASLRLGSSALDVGALLGPERLGAPDVVVLCGCSSLEPSSMGSGEWWGFGVGLLWQGSSAVIGSLWSPYDCPATVAFAAELVAGLRSGEEPAVVLHRRQLAWLREWEGGAGPAFTGAAEDRHPTLWAGWAVTATGVGGPPS